MSTLSYDDITDPNVIEELQSVDDLLEEGLIGEYEAEESKNKIYQNYLKQKSISSTSTATLDSVNHYDDDEDALIEQMNSSTNLGGEEDQVIESYLDTHERLQQNYKNTKANDNTRWGKSANEIYDETKFNFGSYLDVHDKDSKTRRETKFRSSAQWGKSSEQIYDETKLAFGSYLKTEEEKKKQLEEEERRKKLATIEEIKKKKEGDILDPKVHKFPYSELKGKFPKGVKPTEKEKYLTDEEFETVFGMPRREYEKLGNFKKQKMKRDLDLF
ncbi:hypothetical protein ABK040_005045 [Willaertia magna]